MALTPKFLANGQLPNTQTTLYTCPASPVIAVYITRMFLVNTDSSDRTVNVYVKKSGGVSRRIYPKDANISAGSDLNFSANLGGSIILEPGDVLEASASVASVVDYSIFGAQVS